MITERDISLEEAVRKFQPVRFSCWFTSGDVINYNIGQSGTSRVGVFWLVNSSKFSVSIATDSIESKIVTKDLGTFANLEKLRELFPKLFEVTGNLYVR